MATQDQTSELVEALRRQNEILLARLERLENSTRTPSQDPDRGEGEPSTAFSGPDGPTFRPTGKAAWPEFAPFTGPGKRNPAYQDSIKSRMRLQITFDGNKGEFHPFLVKLRSKFREDRDTFRTEMSRMDLLYGLLEGRPLRCLEARFTSETRPFSGVAEMIQTLESVFGNPNEAIEAHAKLQRLFFTIGGKWDITEFIAEFDSLSSKASWPQDQLKHALWCKLGGGLDGSLLTKTRDPTVTYETFCESVKDSVHSKKSEWRPKEARQPDQTRRAAPAAKTPTKNSNKTGPPPVTSQNAGRALTEEEKRVHWDNDTCFTCGKTGHVSRDCPDRAKGVSRLAMTAEEPDQESGKDLPANAVCDTGADTHLLISPTFAKQAAQRLGAKLVTLAKPIQLQDYRRRLAGSIKQQLHASFEVDGRRLPDQVFNVAEMGGDIFIGLFWMRRQRLLLDCASTSIVWPDDLPALAKFSPTIQLSRQDPSCKIDPKDQADADRRDRLIRQDERRYRILQRNWRQPEKDQTPVQVSAKPAPLKTLEEDDQTVIRSLITQVKTNSRWKEWQDLEPTMPRDPVELEEVPARTPTESAGQDDPPTIARISTTAQVYQGQRIPFPKGEDPDHVAMVRQKLPPPLAHLEGFFSKREANTLPLSRPGYDVTLELEKPLSSTGPPSYRTPVKYLPLEKETIDRLRQINFIEPDTSPHAASVLFAPKPYSTDRRFCIDYRWMNDHLKSRITPAPSLEGTAFGCREAQRFTKIDVIQAFHRLRLDPDSEYLTAFRTRFGTFRWKVLPFGLKVGPAWFQQFINAQLHDLLDRCASAYADDVLIYSDKEEDHWKDCQEVIWRLHQANLQGDIKKSRFNVTKVDYLGVLLEAGVGLSVDPRKVRSIQDWKFEDLRDRTAIRSFIGLCNFIRVFCYHASGVAEPLNRLLKKDVAFVMGPEQREAFDQLKRLAIEAPVLTFFRPELPTRLETDASRNATAGVLWQEQPDQTWKPVGFFSKTMAPAERAYPIQDRELLAVVQSLEHFYPELLGQKFDVITDHEALVHFSTKRLLSVRQIRWSDFLAQFDIRFLYRPGRLNVVADALSRKTAELPTVKAREAEERTVTLIPPERLGFATDSLDPTAAGNLPPQNFSPEPKPTRPLVLRATSALQTPEDQGIQQTPDQDRPELDPNSVPKGAELVSLIRQENLLQDLGTHGTRLIVPAQTSDKQTFLQTALIREAHEPQIFAHAGQNKVIKLLQRDFYWPRMKEDIRRYIRNCHDCRRNKTPRDKTPGLLHPLPVPTSVWEHVECDGKDMPKDRYGYDYVWTFVCKLSRIIATLPGKKNDTAEVLASRYFRYLYR
ncbi:hypothetical protein HIM_08979 [Hirsutella minnesotensis 3608]|uniref:Uncharacterized protein n=1 Tax=Hirsutella minnesotensis 3608 TaxID=1043627 RepID=A0A0F7ZY12_9HYPO|nr:hypothetical protein HIM_11657 [Hirsutella minnesotensis 3608]KJZ69258.1 hypothetical protein HIM_11351 [Hirsutella minnesotensis 3608]KJZ71667.1 hypothetical protein HIM_08979 [Hirsutella minnesotensis 3608]